MYNNKENTTQEVPLQPESQNNILSFQALQSQNRELLTNCTELHERMSENRQKRLHAQQQLSKTYRELAQNAADHRLPNTSKKLLKQIRQRIAELEEEHVGLHQTYISQQSLFRETVRDQRRRLVNSVNRTRALTANTGIGLSLVPGTHYENPDWSDAQNDSQLDQLDKRKSA